MAEARVLGRTWWCHGGGAAVLLLLAAVAFFRAPHDVIFWAAIGFFVAHTAITLWRYRHDRRARTTATVIRHHQAHRPDPDRVLPLPLAFSPPPVTSLIRLDLPPR